MKDEIVILKIRGVKLEIMGVQDEKALPILWLHLRAFWIRIYG